MKRTRATWLLGAVMAAAGARLPTMFAGSGAEWLGLPAVHASARSAQAFECRPAAPSWLPALSPILALTAWRPIGTCPAPAAESTPRD